MRVLLVDPIADLLPALQSTLLSIEGVELYCAPDGMTAIQHASLLGGVDVLMTEVFIPGVDGFSVRDAVQKQSPTLLTLFLTRHDLGAYAASVRGTPVLPIPVNPEMVLSSLQQSRPAPTKEIQTIPLANVRTPIAPAITRNPAPQETTAAQKTRSSTARQASFPATKTVEELYIEEPPEARPKTSPAPSSSDTTPARNYAALYPGARLGPYHLFAEESQQPFAQIFSAVHASLSRPVHLVVMHPEQAINQELKDSFLADARAKAQVQLASLLTVFEAGEIENRIFYAIERIDAESLESISRKGKHWTPPWSSRLREPLPRR
jgi:CheY-like chemotaxis protein